MTAVSLPWQSIATAPRTGEEVLGFGRHDRDAPPGAKPLVKAGDPWSATIVWDIWVGMPRWVFAKDGTDIWSEPTHWLDLTPPDGPPALVFPRELTPEIRDVLSLMVWRTCPIAHLFQAAGAAEIRSKTEDEQAFVLHWMTTLALEHGPGWRGAVADRLDELVGIARERTPAPNPSPAT